MRKRLAWGLLLAGSWGCGSGARADGLLGTPLADGGTVMVGAPCAPVIETSSTFDGFRFSEVSVEAAAGDPSGAAVCIAYRFQGRTKCPYGQAEDGGGCTTPDGTPVVGAVPPQCVDRRPSLAVVWSCRCSDANGQTSGGPYCDCPMGTACIQAVDQVATPSLSGGYCLPVAGGANAMPACTAQCSRDTNPCN